MSWSWPGYPCSQFYEASQQVPEFYREAIAVEPVGQQPARDAFVAQATALASDLHRAGHWQTLFTADQINAWLALELEPHYPDLLPAERRDPRIMIRDKPARRLSLYARRHVGRALDLGRGEFAGARNCWRHADSQRAGRRRPGAVGPGSTPSRMPLASSTCGSNRARHTATLWRDDSPASWGK